MTTKAIGDAAERRAAELLERQGYRILERNYRVQSGEIDLVALDGAVVCFVEVRSRGSARHGGAAETITRAKRRRIAHAARRWLFERGRGGACRFDVVAIDPDGARLIRDAFRLEDC